MGSDDCGPLVIRNKTPPVSHDENNAHSSSSAASDLEIKSSATRFQSKLLPQSRSPTVHFQNPVSHEALGKAASAEPSLDTKISQSSFFYSKCVITFTPVYGQEISLLLYCHRAQKTVMRTVILRTNFTLNCSKEIETDFVMNGTCSNWAPCGFYFCHFPNSPHMFQTSLMICSDARFICLLGASQS